MKNNKDNNNNDNHNKNGWYNFRQGLSKLIGWIVILSVFTLIFIYSGYDSKSQRDKSDVISYDTLLEKIASSSTISKIEVGKENLYVYEKPVITIKDHNSFEQLISELNVIKSKNKLYKVIITSENTSLIETLLNNTNIDVSYEPSSLTNSIVYSIIMWVLFLIVILAYNNYLVSNRKKPIFVTAETENLGNLRELPKIRFKDVAGEDEAKESLQELVDFLKNPKKYSKLGAKLPKGALMVGPPGTGKSLLAKAVAGEAGVPFFYKSGSEFVEMYVGVGAKRVRELFDEAKRNSPCIVFLDEIDAIGKSRDACTGTGSDSEKDQTLNELLTQMDGFEVNKGIIVIGATNRPEILDKALLRPGRFDRRVVIDKPNLKGRIEIFKVHCKPIKTEKLDFEELGLLTSGYVGADIANACNEAAILATKRKHRKVTMQDMKDAVEETMVGKQKKDRILPDDEKRIVSFHETGHAFINWVQNNKEPVNKISIQPRDRDGVLGYVLEAPEEERFLQNKKDLENKIRICLGGRAAESILLGEENVTGGCANDLEKCSQILKAMITQYGMGDSLGLYSVARQNNQYLGSSAKIECSPELQYQIDQEIQEKLLKYYKETVKLLKDNWKIVEKIALFLYKEETITGKEFIKIADICKKKPDFDITKI